jgi:anaerobic selenocysteine-containing dehydrogenase
MTQPRHYSRREFLARGALLGGGAFATLAFPALFTDEADASDSSEGAVLKSHRPDAPYELARVENTIYSACLQCNTGCGIKCKIQEGVAAKIDGNPYNPWTLLPHLPFATSPDTAVSVDGSLCPKGQAGMQTAYDPYRLRKVLKRAGRRGENKWVSVPFEQAIGEICEGGALFSHVPGEEQRQVEGLRGLLTLSDADLSGKMAASVDEIWKEKDPAAKAALVAAFKADYAASLDMLIDPDHPDLGPKNNQIVLAWGRMKAGRTELYRRLATALGTVNAHGHTTVCQGSLYFTCKAISEQYIGAKFTDGKKFYWQADLENAEFVLFVGANLFEGNYGPPNRSVRLTERLVSGDTKIAVVDPRFSKLASKAWKWLPVQPGTDGALAMAVLRWMFDHEAYDVGFLSNSNKAAAKAAGDTSWTNATLLVDVSKGTPGKLVRAADIGIVQPETRTGADKKEYVEPFLVAMVGGVPTKVDPNDEEASVVGDLFVSATLPQGVQAKSGLQVLREEAEQRPFEEWVGLTGLSARDVEEVCKELTSHGRRAAVDIHRGVAQHTNGFYNVLGWMTVNMLLGNFDAKGGMSQLSTYDILGTDKGEYVDLGDHPGKIKAFGVNSIRYGIDYEKTTLFAGYPAKRNWYPLSSDIYEEILPSIEDAYPYPVKALFLYMGAPTYALPAGHTNIAVLADPAKLPLFVASDILVGSTSMYADYIFPDLSYLERWEFHGSHPCVPNKVQPVRQPAIAPLVENCTVYGNEVPLSFEAMVLGIAEKLNLPGFGDEAFGEGLPLRHPDDYNLRCMANLAFGEKPDGSDGVPSADAREMEIFRQARAHLPRSVYDEQRWQQIVGADVWPKVVYILNRGGRFEDWPGGWKGDKMGHPYGKLLNLYQEKTASTVHSGTSEHHKGTAAYIPIRDYLGKELDARRPADGLQMVTHRVISQTKSRTIADPWLSALLPENGIIINPADAARLGLKDAQQVRVVSATNPDGEWDLGNGVRKPMIGKLVVTQTVRPGVVSFALGYGHWSTGAADMVIDGYEVKGEERRGRGVHANAAMWTDPTITNTCMFDPVGGSVSFYDTVVQLIPA